MEETQGMWVQSLGWEDPLEEERATHSSIFAWKIPWTEEPGGLQSMGSQRVKHNWAAERTAHSKHLLITDTTFLAMKQIHMDHMKVLECLSRVPLKGPFQGSHYKTLWVLVCAQWVVKNNNNDTRRHFGPSLSEWKLALQLGDAG